AMIVLWAASMYLFYDKKNYWLTAVPATFMSAVSATYFLLGNECLGQLINHKAADGTIIYNTAVAYPIGIAVAALFLGIFLYTIKKRHTQPHYETLGKLFMQSSGGTLSHCFSHFGGTHDVYTCETGQHHSAAGGAEGRQEVLQALRPLRRGGAGAVSQQLLHRPAVLCGTGVRAPCL
ncbi:MAG: hypothetical protein ACLUYM_00985, partial [Oscillospiraceae bacterium]